MLGMTCGFNMHTAQRSVIVSSPRTRRHLSSACAYNTTYLISRQHLFPKEIFCLTVLLLYNIVSLAVLLLYIITIISTLIINTHCVTYIYNYNYAVSFNTCSDACFSHIWSSARSVSAQLFANLINGQLSSLA